MLERAMRLLRPRSQDLKLHWLNNELAIGRVRRYEQWAAVHERGVRAVIDLGDESSGIGSVARENGMRYLRLCTAAGATPSTEELQIVASWAVERMAEGGVFIQDGNGSFNDGLAAAAALIRTGLPAHLALLALRRAVPGVALDYVQTGVLVRFAALQPADASELTRTAPVPENE